MTAPGFASSGRKARAACIGCSPSGKNCPDETARFRGEPQATAPSGRLRLPAKRVFHYRLPCRKIQEAARAALPLRLLRASQPSLFGSAEAFHARGLAFLSPKSPPI